MKKKQGKLIRIISFITGFVLIFLGGVSFAITTIPGIGLIIFSLTGKGGLLK